MLRQFDNFSTWRQDSITIQPHEVATINFKDTTPNIFVIQNSNTAMLKVGISNIPRDNSYEFKVDYNTTETVGRPFGSNNLYILNDSSIEVKVTVFSIQKEFDPTILKNMNVSLNGYTIESNSEISGVVEGVTLPVEDKNSSEAISKLREIAENTSNITLNADTVNVSNEYDDTELKTKIDFISTMFKSFTSASDSGAIRDNFSGVMNSLCEAIIDLKGDNTPGGGVNTLYDLNESISNINTWFRYFTGEAGSFTSMGGIYNLLSDMSKQIKRNGYLYSISNFYNNAISLTHTATDEELYVFEYICNDSSNPLTIYKNQNGYDIEILTIMPNERFENVKIPIANTVKVYLSGEDMMFRAKTVMYRDTVIH